MKTTTYLFPFIGIILATPQFLIGQQVQPPIGLSNKAENKTIYKDCYYITLSNDTIQASIIYSDIINLQHELTIIEPDGNKKTFHPGEIKGFGLRNLSGFSFETDRTRSTDDIEYTLVMSRGLDHMPATIDRNNFYFESIQVNSAMNLFINVSYGENGTLRYLSYYDVYIYHYRRGIRPAIRIVALIEKGNKIFDNIEGETPRKENLWFSRAVSDDSVLSILLKKRRFNIYGEGKFQLVPNIEMIVNEYNNWYASTDKADTSIRLKAIIDAYKYYKPNMLIYIGVSVGYAACGLPGIILALINYHPIKEKNLHIPTNCKYCSDTTYIKTYKDYANKIKTENLYRARTNGLIGALPFLILVAIIGASANN